MTLDDELLQDKINTAWMALNLSLEAHYSVDKIPKVIKLIEDIYRMMLKQERRKHDSTTRNAD